MLLFSFVFRLQDLEDKKHLRASEEISTIEKMINDVIQTGAEAKRRISEDFKAKQNELKM